MSDDRQLSFAAGVISEEYWGRVDQVRNQTGLEILRNFNVLKSGAIQNRTGTTYQATIFNPTHTVQFRPWVFDRDSTFDLEFGPSRLSFWLDGNPVLETGKTITAATQESPCKLTTSGSHSYSVGDKVYLSDLGGMSQLNGRYYKVRTVPSGTTFTLSYAGDGTADGTAVDSTGFTAYTTGGTSERVYSITTPYIEADLAKIKVAQSADLMVITVEGYAPRTLTRTSDTSWTLAVLTNTPSTTCPAGGDATAGAAGSLNFQYQVTAVSDQTGIESLPGTETAYTISGITKANPAVVTVGASHDLVTGDEVAMTVSGMTELTGRRFKVSVAGSYTPDPAITITSITQASPMVVTKNSHGLSNGDKVTFFVTGMTELNDLTYATVTSAAANTFQVYYFGTTTKVNSTGFQAFSAGTVTRISPNPTASTTFTLVGEDSTSYGTFTSGTAYATRINLTAAATPTEAAPNVITTNSAATAGVTYRIYKRLGGIYGWIGETSELTFSDTGFAPDPLDSTPIYREPFQGEDNWPRCCAFYQGRLIMAGSPNNPNGADTSVIGDYTNFTIHSPHEDKDAVRLQTAGYVDSIKDMAALDKLVILTGGAEFVVAGGGEGGTLTPTETNVRPRTYNGSGDLFPLLIDSNVIYLDRGRSVRDFHYSFTADNYQGINRSLFVPDFFNAHTVVDWAYQRNPNSIIWAVREDGVVLTMTYQPDQEMFGWAEHRLYGGTVENVTVIPEGDGEESEDAVYFVVARTLGDGSTTRYVERLAKRIGTVEGIEGENFLDSSLLYDGTGTGTATLSGSGWTNATSLTLTFGTAQTNAIAGNEVQLNGLDADGEAVQIRCRITGVTSTTIVTVIPHTTVPVPMRAVAITDWRMAVSRLTGLDHLEGYTVSIYGDSAVVASALNPAYETTYDVSSGAVQLIGEQRYGYVRVGLPITATAKTLRINPAETGKYVATKKLVTSVVLDLSRTRGPWLGCLEPDDDDEDPIQHLYEPKIRDTEVFGEPTRLHTGPVKVRTQAKWDTNGVVFVRMLEPLPCTILSMSASGALY